MQDKKLERKIKVMAVDDEEDARKLLQVILSSIYEVELASSTSDALSKIPQFKPDLVLTDLKMPGEDGLVLTESLIKLDPNILVLIMTGYADKATAIQAIKRGAFDFLEKPFSPDELRSAVEHAADKIRLKEKLRVAEIKAFDNARLAALGEMAAGVAHEINNPVTIIQGYARVIKKMVNNNQLNSEKILEIAEIIDRTTTRVTKIVTSLRKLARPDTQDFSVVPVKEIIDDTVGICSERFKNTGIRLLLSDISEDLKINCNQLQISQILLNLLNNSYHEVIKMDDPWVKIDVKDFNDMTELSVTDSGLGIPKEIQEKIFQVFFTTKEVGMGTGLGLSLSRQMVENHNGTLTLDSESPNTRFVIVLPKKVS